MFEFKRQLKCKSPKNLMFKSSMIQLKSSHPTNEDLRRPESKGSKTKDDSCNPKVSRDNCKDEDVTENRSNILTESPSRDGDNNRDDIAASSLPSEIKGANKVSSEHGNRNRGRSIERSSVKGSTRRSSSKSSTRRSSSKGSTKRNSSKKNSGKKKNQRETEKLEDDQVHGNKELLVKTKIKEIIYFKSSCNAIKKSNDRMFNRFFKDCKYLLKEELKELCFEDLKEYLFELWTNFADRKFLEEIEAPGLLTKEELTLKYLPGDLDKFFMLLLECSKIIFTIINNLGSFFHKKTVIRELKRDINLLQLE